MDGLQLPTVNAVQQRLGSGGVIGLINFGDERYESFAHQSGYARENLGNALHFHDQDVLIVKGQEVPTKQGHLLVLGIREGMHLKQKRTLEDTISEAKDNNGIIIADHPFYHEGIGEYLQRRPEILNDIDGMEVHNGEAAFSAFGLFPKILPKDANAKAQDFHNHASKRYFNLAPIETSDGHSIREIASSWREIYMPGNYFSLVDQEKVTECLRNGLKGIRPNFGILKSQRKDSNIGTTLHIGALMVSKAKRFVRRQ